MTRPLIHCPSCHRELYHLHLPECSWCGAAISAEEFQKVALPPGSSVPPMQDALPILMPMTEPSWGSSRWGLFNQNPFSLIPAPRSPWESKLRIAGAALFVCLIVARFGETAWGMWKIHQLMPPGH